jgi:hypothetical protein
MAKRPARHEKSEYVTWKKLEAGRSILLDLKSGHYYTLNETATAVWEMVAARMPVDEVVKQMSTMFKSGSKTVAEDIREFVDVLIDKGFVCKTALTVEETSKKTKELVASSKSYVKPTIEEHEAVKEITAAGTSSGCNVSSCSTSHYWYPN